MKIGDVIQSEKTKVEVVDIHEDTLEDGTVIRRVTYQEVAQ